MCTKPKAKQKPAAKWKLSRWKLRLNQASASQVEMLPKKWKHRALRPGGNSLVTEGAGAVETGVALARGALPRQQSRLPEFKHRSGRLWKNRSAFLPYLHSQFPNRTSRWRRQPVPLCPQAWLGGAEAAQVNPRLLLEWRTWSLSFGVCLPARRRNWTRQTPRLQGPAC
jgi:hypothetical protein